MLNKVVVIISKIAQKRVGNKIHLSGTVNIHIARAREGVVVAKQHFHISAVGILYIDISIGIVKPVLGKVGGLLLDQPVGGYRRESRCH